MGRRRRPPAVFALPGRSGPSALGFLACLAALLLASSCAQIEAPSGGPADTEPPRVTDTFPDSGAVGVPALDSLVLVFSEPMDRTSVESSFFLSPPLEYRERRWKDQTWILRLREPLQPGRTYVGLLGTGAQDRHSLSPKAPWSFAFSTGESLDTGLVSGTVHGQRYSPQGALIFVWPWEADPPDTTQEGFPEDPLRLGQSDRQGKYRLEYLPRGRPLRICALYDRNQDRRFDPARDRWGCLDEPLLLGWKDPEPADSLDEEQGTDLFLTAPDEPGTVAGSVIDSSCVQARVEERMARIHARRDSLREWLEGRPDRPEEAGPPAATSSADSLVDSLVDFPDDSLVDPDRPAAPAEGGWVRGLTAEDSLRMGEQLLDLDREERSVRRDSLWCAPSLVARLLDRDSLVVREEVGASQFRWTDVPPGIYRLLAFRDVNENRRADPEEPMTRFPHAIEVRPLRVLDGLDLVLPPILPGAIDAGAPGDQDPGEPDSP